MTHGATLSPSACAPSAGREIARGLYCGKSVRIRRIVTSMSPGVTSGGVFCGRAHRRRRRSHDPKSEAALQPYASVANSGKRQMRQPDGQRSGVSLPSWQPPAATRASQSSSRLSQALSRRPARSFLERITPTPEGPSAQRVQL